LSNKSHYSDAVIEEALRLSAGIAGAAALKLNFTPQHMRYLIRNSAELQRIQVEARTNAVDLAEGKLFELINKGDKTCIIFLLKTHGKDRGYVERHEHGGVGGGPIPVAAVITDEATLAEAAASYASTLDSE